MIRRNAALPFLVLGLAAAWSAAAVGAQGYSLFAALGQPSSGSWLRNALSALPPDVRQALEERLRRRETREVKTPIREDAGFELRTASTRRREIELGIVTLIDRPGVEAEAFAFASIAKVYSNWETDPSAPFDEAASAAAYLKAHPSTAIEPYLRLFQLHRYRSAFEAAVFMVGHPYPEILGAEHIAKWTKRYESIRDQAGAGYVAAWDALRDSKDVVVRALADNLDGKAYVYLNVGAHPRSSKAPSGQSQDRDAAAIDAAKKVIVRDIESSLPQATFEMWLRGVVGPQTVITWGVNDCGEQTGNPALDKGRDFPMCVEAAIALPGDRKLYVMLVVGTFRTGVGPGQPKFWSAAVMKTGEDPKFIDSLALIPAAIRTP